MSIIFPVTSAMENVPLMVHTGGFTFTNGYLLQGAEGNLAIDAPEGMADWLEVQGKKLTGLLLTHCHFDHVVDAARIAREHQCPIYAWGPSTPTSRLETHLKQWAGIDYAVANYPVDRILEGEEAVSAGGRQFRIRHVPGHSPDSLVFIEESESRIFSGDTLMKEGIGRSDFPDGDGDLLVRGIREKILSLPRHFSVFSGHGRPTTVGAELENPFLE